jgi:orotidine-5'-phosphate decarboxylase
VTAASSGPAPGAAGALGPTDPTGAPGPTADRPSFGVRLAHAMDAYGPLCVGIDPHPGLLDAWGLPDDPAGLRELALRVMDAVGGRVAAVKPQSALFERHGAVGVAVLEEVVAAGRQTGTLVIVDAKRGDIGSTMAGYADAYLREGSPLAGDALTVSPYLGFGSLAPAVQAASATGRGLFVLALTSNPEGASVQHAVGPDGRSVARVVAEEAAVLNHAELERADRQRAGATGTSLVAGGDVPVVRAALGSTGLVVGATIGDAARRLGVDLAAVRGPLLAPGVGAQGAGPAELAAVFGDARGSVLASSSRGVLAAGPQIGALRSAALGAAADAAAALA